MVTWMHKNMSGSGVWFDAKDLCLCSMTYHTAHWTTRHLLSQCMTKLLLSLWPPRTWLTWPLRDVRAIRVDFVKSCTSLHQKHKKQTSRNSMEYAELESEFFDEGRLDRLDTGVKRDGKAWSNSKLQCQDNLWKSFLLSMLIQFQSVFNYIQPVLCWLWEMNLQARKTYARAGQAWIMQCFHNTFCFGIYTWI